MKKLELHWQILIALILAIVFGIYFKDYVSYVSWMGEIFLRALKMIIIPLIFSSIVSGVSNIGNAENIGRLGFRTILYYISTSILGILTGLVLVNVFRPGVGVDLNLGGQVDLGIEADSLGDTLIKIVPENVFSAFSTNAQMLSVIFLRCCSGFYYSCQIRISGIAQDLFQWAVRCNDETYAFYHQVYPVWDFRTGSRKGSTAG